MMPKKQVFRRTNPLNNYLAIKRNPIAFLTEIQKESGDFARFRILNLNYYLINDPDLIREALVEKSETLIIKGGASGGLARLIGHGILTNRGEQWKESRRSLQPLFSQTNIDSYASIIRERTEESLERWRREFTARAFSINRELLALSFRIKCSTLFRYIPSFDEALAFADAIWILQSDGMRRYMIGLDFLSWLPSALNRHVNRAVCRVAEIASKISPGAGQPVDEILSLLFAGTESPANTLCWAMRLLDDHEEWQSRITSSDSNDSLSSIINEVMRLYPAGWAFERFSPGPSTLGGFEIEPGARLLFSPFLLHRNLRFWHKPEQFDPGRFPLETNSKIPKFAFLPFGAGPRSCIGSRLALSEMRIVLELLYTHARWRLIDHPDQLEPRGSFKIRLSRPLLVEMEPFRVMKDANDKPPQIPHVN